MIREDANKQFYELFRRKDKFIRFAHSYVLDEQVAEDLVMDSFLYYWENRNHVDDNDNLQAYIIKILKHKCLDYLKLQKIHNEIHKRMQDDALWDINMNIASLEQLQPYKLMTDECHRAVVGAVNQLPGKTREIFLMSRMREMKNREIAEKMEISEKTVEYHMTKALKFLKDKLKGMYLLTFFMI